MPHTITWIPGPYLPSPPGAQPCLTIPDIPDNPITPIIINPVPPFIPVTQCPTSCGGCPFQKTITIAGWTGGCASILNRVELIDRVQTNCLWFKIINLPGSKQIFYAMNCFANKWQIGQNMTGPLGNGPSTSWEKDNDSICPVNGTYTLKSTFPGPNCSGTPPNTIEVS